MEVDRDVRALLGKDSSDSSSADGQGDANESVVSEADSSCSDEDVTQSVDIPAGRPDAQQAPAAPLQEVLAPMNLVTRLAYMMDSLGSRALYTRSRSEPMASTAQMQADQLHALSPGIGAASSPPRSRPATPLVQTIPGPLLYHAPGDMMDFDGTGHAAGAAEDMVHDHAPSRLGGPALPNWRANTIQHASQVDTSRTQAGAGAEFESWLNSVLM